MSKRRGGKVEEEIYWRRRGWKQRRSSVKQKTGNERKTGKIADFSFLSLLRGNKLWLSNQLQPLCHKSSHMSGTMTLSSLRSLSFLHAFLFWGVLMNDLKSDLFPNLRGRGARRGGVWTVCVCEGGGEHAWRFSCENTHFITHQAWIVYFIHEGKGASIQVHSGFLMKQNRPGWKCRAYVGRLFLCSAVAVWSWE